MRRLMSVLSASLVLAWAVSLGPQLAADVAPQAQHPLSVTRAPQPSMSGAVNRPYVVLGVTAGVTAVAGVGILVSFAHMSGGRD